MLRMSGHLRKTCLITGASGFLGRHFVEAARTAGYHPIAAGIDSAAGIENVRFDLAGRSPVPPLPGPLDAVFHLAGLAHFVPRTAAESDRFFEINARGTGRLLEALRPSPPRLFLLVSTVAVYGRETGENLDESTPRTAEDPYGRSKAEAEDLLLKWAAETGARASIVRLPLVIGASAPGNFGKMVGAMRRGRYLRIGGGAARRSMVLAAEAARGAFLAAEAGGTFHLTDGQHPSFRELESVIASSLALRSPVNVPMPVARLLASGGDLLEALSRRRLPFNRRTLLKMTSSLTFSDQRARTALGWQSRPVISALPELLATWS